MRISKWNALPIVLFILSLTVSSVRAEVMLQWFETEWDEMYRRIPEVAETGYSYIWCPPPTKAPTGKGTIWGNVGYSLYDRFDIGDIPQRGTMETRYGSRGSLRNMVDKMHQCDVKIIPDIVMNHNGNGPDFREYPGMRPTDFHVWYEEGYCNSLNYKRGPRMSNWGADNGYGATMYEDLCSLIDIRTEDCTLTRGWGTQDRFTAPNGPQYVAGESFTRHIGQYDKYPYYNPTTHDGYGDEEASDMLYRWIAWLGNAMDYDGLRLDAGKHTPWEFFGTDETGFLHEAQYNQSLRRGYTNYNDSSTVFQNYIDRDHSLIFAEILSPWSEIEYWANNNPMRFLDYQIKKTADGALSGNIGGFYGYGTDFGPTEGIMYVWGHDEGPADKVDLGYAYTLTHIGLPMVYYTGKNIEWQDKWDNRTWMIPGYDGYALGDDGSKIQNLVWIHNNFAWGKEYNRWADGDFLALERYDDLNGSGSPDSGEGILLVALNDSGGDIAHELQTSFADGTELKDYTGKAGNTMVYGGGKAYVNVPANGGQGWVCYAPVTPDVSFDIPGASTMDWIVPGGVHGTDKARTLKRITSNSFSIDATPSSTVEKVCVKWGNGKTAVGSGTHYTNHSLLITANYEEMSGSGTSWSLSVSDADTKIPEGLNAIKVRAYSEFPDGSAPARFNTATEVVYVDLHGPELDVPFPAEGETVRGAGVMIITNADYTAYGITVSINGGSAESADEHMKGYWKYNLSGLGAGTHTAVVTATEADWGSPRQVINTSTFTRVFSVADNANSISISHSGIGSQKSGAGHIELPFFSTAVNVSGSPDDVKLYWDGYELPFNGGSYTNIFNGEVVFRDFHPWVVTNRLWGNFVNGVHFFEAVRVDGGVTSRASERVVFNLYGQNVIDSDGDAVPDNVEIPFFTDNAIPNEQIPGDNNQNAIPDWGETWTRLNPYNHSTFYSGEWDDRNDFDGDGYNNYEEVYAGYVEDNNVYKYDIYNGASHPSGTPVDPADVTYFPDPALRTNNFTVYYVPNDGPLSNAAAINIHIGHSYRTMGVWQDVESVAMVYNASSNRWEGTYMVPSNATSVDFVFNDGGSIWDSNNGNDWQASVEGETPEGFVMDGEFDSDGYTVISYDMKILAAVKGANLYVATWGANDGPTGNDHFLYVAPELGDASDPAPGWNKAGLVFYDTATYPYITAEGNNDFSCWNNASGLISNKPGGALEGVINMNDVFGSVPEFVYVASAAYGTDADGAILSQSPYKWDDDGNINITEFQRISIANIRDDNNDGVFDNGAPQMWTVTDGNTNDANYGLLRYFLNEPAGDEEEITVILQPNTGTNALTDVELFSNLNRRDFVVLPGEEDPDSVTTTSATTYYRAYPMSSIGGGQYRATIKVNKCGVYRINARYRVNGGDYVYYTENALRRDCVVVASPTKAHELVMYELNPMTAEAQDTTFAGRSTFEDAYKVNTEFADAISTSKLSQLGVNMIWLQPIHPIGSEGRQTDPLTGSPYDPGSPYAVRNYFKVNSVLGDPATPERAMTEFTNFVQAMDGSGIGVMLDGTFNHSAWDCEVAQPAVDMFDWASDPAAYIRSVKPDWYSKVDNYDEGATHFESMSVNDIATAPDRCDFGKWSDAVEFHFGNYDCLVAKGPADTNWAWSSQWFSRYLFEYDDLEPLSDATKDLWEYFAYYPIYWLEKTGHPQGTDKLESYRGIDGLRCDFAQGLPNQFWEYTINKTRSLKWDFLFMAESLDGYRTVNGSPHHGVGFRSSRQFDILNENLVFFWRDNFFAQYAGGGTNYGTPNRTTSAIKPQFDDRKTAFMNSPILLNLTSHDEIFPTYDQASLFNAYAAVSAMAGVPMMMYGQEAGAQNNYSIYNRGDEIDPKNNWEIYEVNFGKGIPNFKRYNCMTSVWYQCQQYMTNLLGAYGRVSKARQNSPALQSQNDYFLSKTEGGYDENIFAVAKYEAAGVSAASQDVVFVFVNNDSQTTNSRASLFSLDADINGNNWFGIIDDHTYTVVDLASTTPTTPLWDPPKLGSEFKTNFYVGLNGAPMDGTQVQFLKLIDTAATYPTNSEGHYSGSKYSNWDRDGDGLPTWWKEEYGLTAEDGPDDVAPNGMTYMQNYLAGTAPSGEPLAIEEVVLTGSQVDIKWASKANINYLVEYRNSLTDPAESWKSVGPLRTALGTETTETDTSGDSDTNRYYRLKVKP
jgi:hypothetical protein